MGFDVGPGTTALVTGASSGIGAAIAVGLAERGCTVGICARRADRLADVLDRCRQHAPASRSWTIDLADLDGVTAFAEQAERELGGIDLLVNNAGVPKRKTVAALRIDEVDDTMAVNYNSPVRLILALLPAMRDRGRGAIVTIGSVAARMSPPGETAYSATKAAITAFSEGLAAELWDTPLQVHVIHPGIIETELFGLPDNDPSFSDDIEPLPARDVFEAMATVLESGTFESYVPAWFADVASGKATDMDGYIAGAAAYWRSKVSDA